MLTSNEKKYVKNTAKAVSWGIAAAGLAMSAGLAPIAVTCLGSIVAKQMYRGYSNETK